MRPTPWPAGAPEPPGGKRLPGGPATFVFFLCVTLLSPPSGPTVSAAAPSPALRASGSTVRRPAARCRGSTRARVAIHWPTSAELAADKRLHLSARVPAAVRRWAYLVEPDARAAGVDPYLVAGVMQVESHGDPLAWNLDSDARGLMQVLHAPFEPADNLRIGISMLADLQRRFGSRDLVLAGYNAGAGSVQTYGGVPPYTETRDYIVLVEYYRDLYGGLTMSRARKARFNAAWADLVAYYRRICGGRM